MSVTGLYHNRQRNAKTECASAIRCAFRIYGPAMPGKAGLLATHRVSGAGNRRKRGLEAARAAHAAVSHSGTAHRMMHAGAAHGAVAHTGAKEIMHAGAEKAIHAGAEETAHRTVPHPVRAPAAALARTEERRADENHDDQRKHGVYLLLMYIFLYEKDSHRRICASLAAFIWNGCGAS